VQLELAGHAVGMFAVTNVTTSCCSSWSPCGAPPAGSWPPTLTGMDRPAAPMWHCPSCGRAFANTNQTHSCRPLGDLERHFAGSAPHVRHTFDRIVAVLEALGPVTVLAERTRIAFQTRMSFAAVTPRRRWLGGHLVLARPVASPRFHSVQTFSPRNVLHAFRLHLPAEVDAEFASWLAEAYAVGQQQHLRPNRG